jgi:hypothetical protein
MRSVALSFVLALALASLPRALCATESAQEAAAPGALAVEKGREGVILYEQGKWQEAVGRLQEAEALYHSPVFVLYMARSLNRAGRLLEARDVYRRLSSENIASSAPESWRQAQADGDTELSALEASMPRLIVVVHNATPATKIAIDDRGARAGDPVFVDPGQHRVVVVDGKLRREKLVTLRVGAPEEHLVFELPRPKGTRVAPEKSGVYTPGLLLVGTGLAAMATGGVFGVLALNESADVRKNLPEGCIGTDCLPRTRGEIEQRMQPAQDYATTADVLLISGAAVTTLGVVLWILHSGSEPTATAQLSPRGGSLRVQF